MTRLLMADHETRGVQAYRWFVTVGVAAVGYFAFDTRQTMKELASDVTALKVQVSIFNSRVDAHADRLRSIDDRNSQQDTEMRSLREKIEELARRLYQGFRPGQVSP